jgi:3'-phosphoadenosine 5'-phosphosulfate sulfotransferase (PAPS reductase)/FAD synthetase
LKNIVALSGGLSSFYAAYLSLQKYGKDMVQLYFNDTKWEHKDLYRFLEDIEIYLDKQIYRDSDGRSPEQVFYDEHFLGCDRIPLCSKILKAQRLQKHYKHGDNLIFGIGTHEKQRASRILAAYQVYAAKSGRYPTLEFPLIDENIIEDEIKLWFKSTKIKLPELYRLGFSHNNCSGGCVRQGKQQWLKLLYTYPDIYADRERLEIEFSNHFDKPVHYMKDMTLTQLRLSREKLNKSRLFDPEYECYGACNFVN